MSARDSDGRRMAETACGLGAKPGLNGARSAIAQNPSSMSTDNSEALLRPLETERLALPDDGPIADAAREIASYCDAGTARWNVYRSAKQHLAKAAITRPSSPAASDDAVAVCRMIVNLGPEDDDLRAIRRAAERALSAMPLPSPVSYGGADLRGAFPWLFDDDYIGEPMSREQRDALRAALAQSTASSTAQQGATDAGR